jgi:hypothetical protein
MANFKFKPCPKCGATNHRAWAHRRPGCDPVRKMYFLECCECGHRVQGFEAGQAIARWNTPATKKAP